MNGFEFKEIANSFKSLADKLPDFSIPESKEVPIDYNNKLETKIPDFNKSYLTNIEVNSNTDSVEKYDNPKRTSSEIDNHASEIPTKNSNLEGTAHPVTGVEFVRKTVETDTGELVEGVFPDFESIHDVQLPPELEKATDNVQFKECNSQLKDWVVKNPEQAKEKFSEEQLVDIMSGRTPDECTWHHNEDKGKMQLMDSEIHAKTGHTGGKKIWGGGDDNR